jgi:hypothetical protein
MAPDPETPIHRDVSALRAEINRNADILRSHEVPHENLQPTRPPYMSAPSYDHGGAVSPRQQAMDASRRPSLQPASRASSFRTPMPPHMTASPHKFGSLSGPSGPPSPSSRQPAPPPPPPPTYSTLPPPPAPAPANAAQAALQHRPASPPMNLSRRHTSADLRLQGWNGPPHAIPPPPPPQGTLHNGLHLPSVKATTKASRSGILWHSTSCHARHPDSAPGRRLRPTRDLHHTPTTVMRRDGSSLGQSSRLKVLKLQHRELDAVAWLAMCIHCSTLQQSRTTSEMEKKGPKTGSAKD